MLLLLSAFLGGALTILSPCILPVLPFVFARADRPFVRNGLPMLLGMAITFALTASLAFYGGGWIVRASSVGRAIALALLGLFAISLLVPSVAERCARPFVRLGNRLMNVSSREESVFGPFVLGIAVSMLWAPCAGPILGLILAGAALSGPTLATALLLLAYALGAAASLALALLAGNRVFATLKRSLGVEEWIRRGLGIVVLLAVAAIAFGWDRGVLTSVAADRTAGLEQLLVDWAHPVSAVSSPPNATKAAIAAKLPDEGAAPELSGATAWLNGPPLSREALRDKVVLVEFWTYSCINCLRTLPYTKAWAARYGPSGLVIVGVHTPEFAFEKEIANVRQATAQLGVTYPVAIDDEYAIWNAFHNQYWPAQFLIDSNWRLRYQTFGEGSEATTEQAIRALLRERNGTPVSFAPVVALGSGAEAPADTQDIASEETYLGAGRGGAYARYDRVVPNLALNAWGVSGPWQREEERMVLRGAPGAIALRFHARDMHVVLGPLDAAGSIRFRVRLDGRAPGADAGSDVDADGFGIVREHRLYQIIRQKNDVVDRTVEIEFLAPGVAAYSFTFG